MNLDITIDTMIIPVKTIGKANIGVTMIITDDSRRSSGNNRRFDDDSRGNSWNFEPNDKFTMIYNDLQWFTMIYNDIF